MSNEHVSLACVDLILPQQNTFRPNLIARQIG